MHHFIQKIYLRNSLNAALGRGAVYAPNANKLAQETFKEDCKRWLIGIGVRYTAWEWDLDQYCNEIEALCATISRHHGPVLRNGRLRVGTGQKMISLYLKLLWLSGDVSKKPIGAVLDRPILQASGYPNPPDWTKLDDLVIYKNIQNKIQNKAEQEGYGSAAVWESEKWGVENDADS